MNTREGAQKLAALAQETRLDLLRLLLAEGASGLAAGEIAVRLGVPASTLSFHLSALEREGLVGATRQGRRVVYAARLMGLRALLGFLTETCCGGRPELCGDIGRLVEGEERAMASTFNVLFLCTRNSARSIMAEAILAKTAPGRFASFSAGSEPSPEGPMPEVLAQLKALGHDVSGLRSKSWNEFAGPEAPRMDFVITLCDIVAGQVCPDFGATTVTASWPLPDPAKFTGSAAERATLLNELYAGLRRRLEAFTALPFATLDRLALKARVDELADPHVRAR